MSDDSLLVIQSLGTSHDRSGFRCGVAALDTYLDRQARQDVKRQISRVFVAALATLPNTILGYYTLSSLAIELDTLPHHLARRLPHHPVPAALMGRLAVSDEIAIYALVVDAIDEGAQRFHEQFGFSLLRGERRRSFLPLRSV